MGKKLKLAILGSRGIPNRYGGFEQFAEKLSVGLARRGMEVWVYNSHNHPCRDATWNGVHRIFCQDPEFLIGQAGQFIYDLNCINDSRKRDFDIIFQLGTTSSSVWHRRLPRGVVVVTNMDGLEWKRSKYSAPVRRFLKHAEKLAVKSSDHLVADSEAIQQYLQETYGVPSACIAYGADIPHGAHDPGTDPARDLAPVNDFLQAGDGGSGQRPLERDGYFLLIARLQPDNHIEEIIRGVIGSGSEHPLLVVGNDRGRFAGRLKKKYANAKYARTHAQPNRVIFTGGIYDIGLLDRLRRNARLYFHGHSAGGTNPSLLEAMAAGALICAHDNPFNRWVLGEDAWYFRKGEDIADLAGGGQDPIRRKQMKENNLLKIRERFSWEGIIGDYEALFYEVARKSGRIGRAH
jgi:glycosyltransferase involved in cell wall biosynthesis